MFLLFISNMSEYSRPMSNYWIIFERKIFLLLLVDWVLRQTAVWLTVTYKYESI